jgi:hypothetical protein
MQRLSSLLRARALDWTAAAALLAIAACVSLTPQKGGTGNIPVVTGGYKSGATQLVRIALDGSVPDSRLTASGDWALFAPGNSSPAARFQAGQELTVSRNGRTLMLSPNANVGAALGQIIARPLTEGSFLTWNGKRYRGDLTISATDSGLLVVNQLPMDSYLRGVVPLEIGNRTAAEMAAVQAQAVAARTYAYKHLIASRLWWRRRREAAVGRRDHEHRGCRGAVQRPTDHDAVSLHVWRKHCRGQRSLVRSARPTVSSSRERPHPWIE